MLHWFRCDNCYSFSDGKKENGISMVALAKADINSEVKPVERGNAYIWQAASIYGANASGKSTFLKALGSMFYNIADSRSNLVGERFIFDYSSNDEPIFCEMCFSLKKPGSETEYNEYRYGYELNTCEDGRANNVSSEWLKMRNLDSDEELTYVFNRKGNDIDFDKHVNSQVANQMEAEFKRLKEHKRESTLFMRLAGNVDVDVEPFSSILAWCRKAVPAEFFAEEEGGWQLARAAAHIKDENFKAEILTFMKKFDKCIADIKVNTKNEKYDIMIVHQMQNSAEGDNPVRDRIIYQESYGTQKMVGMYQFFYNVMKQGGLLIIDEFDIKLHPWVIRDLIRNIHDNNKNLKAAQIIFSTHSLAALNKHDMHMDEIYFVGKNDEGKSSIARLDKRCFTEEELENAYADYAKLYLDNRFGAIPTEELSVLGGNNNE